MKKYPKEFTAPLNPQSISIVLGVSSNGSLKELKDVVMVLIPSRWGKSINIYIIFRKFDVFDCPMVVDVEHRRQKYSGVDWNSLQNIESCLSVAQEFREKTNEFLN